MAFRKLFFQPTIIVKFFFGRMLGGVHSKDLSSCQPKILHQKKAKNWNGRICIEKRLLKKTMSRLLFHCSKLALKDAAQGPLLATACAPPRRRRRPLRRHGIPHQSLVRFG